MAGQACDCAGAHQGKDNSVNREEGELLSDLLPPTEKEHIGHDGQEADRADQMNCCRGEECRKEGNITDMTCQKESGAYIETEFQKIISCCVQYQRGEANPAARIQADGSNQGKDGGAERSADFEGCRQFITKILLVMEKKGETEKQT